MAGAKNGFGVRAGIGVSSLECAGKKYFLVLSPGGEVLSISRHSYAGSVFRHIADGTFDPAAAFDDHFDEGFERQSRLVLPIQRLQGLLVPVGAMEQAIASL